LSTATIAIPHKLSEQGFVPIGGQEQWVTLNGEDCKKPAILFLHGGPGNPLSPFAQNLYGSWAKDFTLVQWDQRGAGQTFGRNPGTAESILTLDQMVNDGIAVAEWVGQRLGQKKLILMGSSWGSVLGVHMAKRRPDLFHAYVGTAQMVSYQANEAASYAQTLALATAADDKKTVAALQAIGLPPRTDPRAFGVLRRAIRAYEGKASTPAHGHGGSPGPTTAARTHSRLTNKARTIPLCSLSAPRAMAFFPRWTCRAWVYVSTFPSTWYKGKKTVSGRRSHLAEAPNS
jgi:pimeloyl-ACP methyl ester carboxylesterase